MYNDFVAWGHQVTYVMTREKYSENVRTIDLTY